MSGDGQNWEVLADKSDVTTSLPHDFIVKEEGIYARFVKLTVKAIPYQMKACVSGLRIFGLGEGSAPQQTENVSAIRSENGMDMRVNWKGDAVGYEVLWGHKADKLYHSYRVFGTNEVEVKALVAGTSPYYVRVDAFNENGITEGNVIVVDKTN